MLLISRWVVAASFRPMAEKPNVDVAIFVADNTSMCGFGSDGAAALLSACSLVRCGSHPFVFPCLEVFLGHSTLCDQLQDPSRIRVDVDRLHISLYRRLGRPVVLLPSASSP